MMKEEATQLCLGRGAVRAGRGGGEHKTGVRILSSEKERRPLLKECIYGAGSSGRLLF